VIYDLCQHQLVMVLIIVTIYIEDAFIAVLCSHFVT